MALATIKRTYVFTQSARYLWAILRMSGAAKQNLINVPLELLKIRHSQMFNFKSGSLMRPNTNFLLLGTLTISWKILNYIRYAYLSVRPHGKTWLLLCGFSRNFKLMYFPEICR
jgi:hypothetical protein